MHRSSRGLMTVFAGVCLLSACGGSPMSATPPAVDPGAPKISCPTAPQPVVSTDGQSAIVGYATPTVAGGTTPLNGPTCTPGAATAFKVGSTPVTCTVVDAQMRSDACTFNV